MNTGNNQRNRRTESVMTKSSLPVGGYSVNPWVLSPRIVYETIQAEWVHWKNWKPIHRHDGERDIRDGWLQPYEGVLCCTHRL